MMEANYTINALNSCLEVWVNKAEKMAALYVLKVTFSTAAASGTFWNGKQHYDKFSQNKQKLQYTWSTLTYRLLCNTM